MWERERPGERRVRSADGALQQWPVELLAKQVRHLLVERWGVVLGVPRAAVLTRGALPVLLALPLVACLEERPRKGSAAAPAAAKRDVARAKRHDDWYQRQAKMDCVPGPYDEAAMAAVLRAFRGDKKQAVHGPPDPLRRSAKQLANMKTRPNPAGRGVVVTAWEDSNRRADYARQRLVWLVLDAKVYPLNTEAAMALSRLHDGLPESIQRRSGLMHTYERGRTVLDQLGLEDRTYVRRHSGPNPFPTCE
jgi:hypothetical protein